MHQTSFKVYPSDDPETAAAKAHKDFGPVKDKGKKKKKKENKEEKPLPIFPTYKYSKQDLHESITLAGIPSFIKYDCESGEVIPVEKIKEPSRILRPPNREESPFTPYDFASSTELSGYVERAKNETNDSLYQKAKSIVKKYNDQDEHKQILLATDLFWSYFQDKFGTTHYLVIVGDNDSGKSSIGNTFEAVAYRAVNMTSPTASNIFRILGTIESGQCILILDEAEKIDESVDIMNILKTGYDYNKRVPKTNTNTWKQEFFYTYGLKIIIAEKSPSRFKAKGLLDRTLSFTVYPGESEFDIKEVTNPQERTPHLDDALNELIDFRKLMLIYRLIHFSDPIIDLDVGLKRRNRELCKPYIRLFYGTAAQKEIEETFQIFLDIKNSRKAGSIEAILIPVIVDLVERKGKQVVSSEVWDFIKEELEGESYGSDEYHISDYILYRNTITRMLEDKFGAESKHTNKGNITIFNLDKLQKIQRSYDTEITIKTRPKNVIEYDGECSEGSEGYRDQASASEGGKTVEDLDNGNGKDEDISRNAGSEGHLIAPAVTRVPSQPSQPSPIVAVAESVIVAVDNDNTPSPSNIEPFFHDDLGVPWQPLPEHDLEQSPCYHIIEKDKFKTSGQSYYRCKLHPDIWNIDIQGIEHHCKYHEPEKHKSEILKILAQHSL